MKRGEERRGEVITEFNGVSLSSSSQPGVKTKLSYTCRSFFLPRFSHDFLDTVKRLAFNIANAHFP